MMVSGSPKSLETQRLVSCKYLSCTLHDRNSNRLGFLDWKSALEVLNESLLSNVPSWLKTVTFENFKVLELPWHFLLCYPFFLSRPSWFTSVNYCRSVNRLWTLVTVGAILVLFSTYKLKGIVCINPIQLANNSNLLLCGNQVADLYCAS
jgi:hypothetical protein